MSASLPATILGDLRAFIHNTRKPLVVRSSGVLEDSLLQSFAGIYDSILLPNESWETDFRFQDVCNAIKYVYASTFFEKARTYIKSTPKNIGDEKMAVIIQEVIGRKHETYFYPAISGVAKSYNYFHQVVVNKKMESSISRLVWEKPLLMEVVRLGFVPRDPIFHYTGLQRIL
ncbi:Pyruvate phosphate dikinase, PEP/pyruvate binding domain [uncultured archaeon]|nr:Pyruvate phosphate dikinase, PEP/pyruvate binding domain [uncultured archaeon]